MSRDRSLPLWATIKVAFNVEKYGHPIEHYAERMFLWMLFGAVVGSVIGGVIATVVPRFVKRQSLAQSPAPHRGRAPKLA